MMVDLAEVVLYAMFQQAESEGRHLYVDEAQVGHALSDLDGYGRMVHLEKAGGDGHLRVVFT